MIEKVIGGLQWAEEGYPNFLCLLVEQKQNAQDSLEPQTEYLNIIKEIEGETILELTEQIEDEMQLIYAPNDAKYTTFIRDFNTWRREEGYHFQFKPSVHSSFESGILRIKDFIREDKLRFPKDSKIKEQLKIFSELSYKSKGSFYAVSALSHAISSIRKRVSTTAEPEPELGSWH
ncbi:MAG: hypothetical protein ABSD50_14115 [Smithella sp.]